MTTEDRIRMQYLGVLQLLGNVAAYLPTDDDLHESVLSAMSDACEVIPTLHVRRVLNRYDLDILPDAPATSEV